MVYTQEELDMASHTTTTYCVHSQNVFLILKRLCVVFMFLQFITATLEVAIAL